MEKGRMEEEASNSIGPTNFPSLPTVNYNKNPRPRIGLPRKGVESCRKFPPAVQKTLCPRKIFPWASQLAMDRYSTRFFFAREHFVTLVIFSGVWKFEKIIFADAPFAERRATFTFPFALSLCLSLFLSCNFIALEIRAAFLPIASAITCFHVTND